MSTIATFINTIINNLGIQIQRFPNVNDKRLINFLTKNNVNTCIDVGANKGQFVKKIRKIGFTGNIISFEPQQEAFLSLSKNAKNDINWKVYNYALGDFDGDSEINISKNSVSSSLLNMMPNHSNAAPTSGYISKEKIEVRKLDTLFNDLVNAKKCFLKIDTQGFESKVLKGSINSLRHIYAIELEMACVELYEGELLFDEMKKHIETLGFILLSIESGFADDTSGKLLQIEAVFVKL